MTEADRIYDYLLRIRQILEDIFQSGFDTVHDSTLEELRQCSQDAAQYGMEKLAGLTEALLLGFQHQRHQMERDDGPLMRLYGELNQYVFISRQKLDTDQVKLRLNALQEAADRRKDESSR